MSVLFGTKHTAIDEQNPLERRLQSTYLLKMFGLHFQPTASNGLIPISDIDRWVCQKAGHAPYRAKQLRFTRDFARNPAQLHQAALMNPDDQPGEAHNAGLSFCRKQLSNSHNPSRIETVDRHGILLSLLSQNQEYTFHADQPFSQKVCGS